MFLISGNETTSVPFSLFALQNGNANQLVDVTISPGSVDSNQSLCELMDCAIIYYYAIAHKYVVMVSITYYIINYHRNDHTKYIIDR